MTHYQKLATMIFRTIGLLLVLAGTVTAIIATVLFTMFTSSIMGVFVGVVYSVPLLTAGIGLHQFARGLSRLVCFDFDRFNDV